MKCYETVFRTVAALAISAALAASDIRDAPAASDGRRPLPEYVPSQTVKCCETVVR